MSIESILERAKRVLEDERVTGRERSCAEHMYLRLLSTAKEYDFNISPWQYYFKEYMKDKNNVLMRRRRTEMTND